MGRDNYQHVTDTLVDLLGDVDPTDWQRPWAGGAPRPENGHSGHVYRGANTLLLWARATAEAYSSHEWFTFRQAKKAGGHVKKGETGTPICFFDVIEKEVEPEEGGDDEPETETFPILKTYTVFNVDQTTLDPESDDFEPLDAERVDHVDAFIDATGAEIEHDGAAAAYRPADDVIQLPAYERFHSRRRYYTTTLHELAHWTGHPDRLDRGEKFERFGTREYAAEELTAELASAFVAADLGLELEYEEPAAYLKSWLRLMRDDKYALFTAARAAEDAAEYLHDQQPDEETEAA